MRYTVRFRNALITIYLFHSILLLVVAETIAATSATTGRSAAFIKQSHTLGKPPSVFVSSRIRQLELIPREEHRIPPRPYQPPSRTIITTTTGSFRTRTVHRRSALSSTSTNTSTAITTSSAPHLVFPGGGLFFYWQAGAVTYLREQGYDLSQVCLTGASAGALTATLTAANVDFAEATELALGLAERGGVWDRPLGLQGVWGEMIREWLDVLLPEDVLDVVGDDRLSLLITPVPSFGKERISTFQSRSDLIQTNMVSVHIPWFLDGKITASHRGRSCIDGSFLSKPTDYQPVTSTKSGTNGILTAETTRPSNTITLDWTTDPVLANKSLADAVSVVSKTGIWDILARGKEYAAIMEECGDFEALPKLRL